MYSKGYKEGSGEITGRSLEDIGEGVPRKNVYTSEYRPSVRSRPEEPNSEEGPPREGPASSPRRSPASGTWSGEVTVLPEIQ